MQSAIRTSFVAISFLLAVSSASAQPTAAEIESIAVDAYAYFYPIVSMDVSRRQMTNVATAEGFFAPMNVFAHAREYPPAEFKGVVRPNFDTLYSSLWMDLTHGPVVLSLPDSNGRYYLAPALDMWTDVFFSPGTRTTGNSAADYAYVPPGWEGELPEGLVRVDVPTLYCWIIGRTQANGPADYDAVRAFQDGMKVTRLADWGKASTAVVMGEVDAGVDMHTPPKTQVDSMSGEEYFEYAAKLLAMHPAHVTDQGILAQLRRIGIQPGQELAFGSLSADVQAALNQAPAKAQQAMQAFVPRMARVENGWSMNTESMGVYGNNYLRRAVVAQVGLGANLPEDAVYPLLVSDADGHPLAEGHSYTLHFEKADLPPVDAFWSITLYDGDGFGVPNSLHRQNLAGWMPFVYNADGSLDLYFQSESPGADKEANWLPAPATGAWNLTMRLYHPRSVVAEGAWIPPAVHQAGE